MVEFKACLLNVFFYQKKYNDNKKAFQETEFKTDEKVLIKEQFCYFKS